MSASGGELGDKEASTLTKSARGLEDEREELCTFFLCETGEFERLGALSGPSSPKWSLSRGSVGGCRRMDDGDINEDAPVGVVDIYIWALLVLIEIARFWLSSDAGVVERGDEEVANEVVAEDRCATLEDGTGEKVVDIII